MQTITTTFKGQTETLPHRIIARSTGGATLKTSLGTLEYNRIEEAHAIACRRLMDRLNWKGQMVAGVLNTGAYVWVFSDSPDRVARP